MEGAEPDALVTTVQRRWSMLETLADGPCEQPELVETLDSSRSTVYRGVKELRTAGLVSHGETGYTLTAPGRVLVAEYRSFLATVEPVATAMDLLAVLPERTTVDPAMLRDAEVVSTDPPDNAAPGRRMGELISRATRIRGLFRAHTQSDAAAAYRQALDDGVRIEGVYEASFWEYLSAHEPAADIRSSPRFVAHRVESLPYGLALFDLEDGSEPVALLVYDGDKQLRGLVVNDTDDARGWAADVFETYREQATPVGE